MPDDVPERSTRVNSAKTAQCYFSLAVFILAIAVAACGGGAEERMGELEIGDAPALKVHTSQDAINKGELSLEEIIERGEILLSTSFNTLDGAGRPETAGVTRVSNFVQIIPRPRQEFPRNFNRISGPDANSCITCHNIPRGGGGGDNATNVFADADRLAFVNFDGGEGDNLQAQTLQSVGVERNAPGVFGSGFIELLAREMTMEFRGIVNNAVKEARSKGTSVTAKLVAKGVSFGEITVRPDGVIDTSKVEGVDDDLVIRPFQQKGIIVSLREFVVKAMNSHFGMQAAELFRDGFDFDQDGVVDELTRGDITALVIFMATAPVPGRVMPAHPEARAAAERGEELFSAVGCTTCHILELRLNNPVFTEPSPLNPGGKLQPGDVPHPFAVDLTSEGPGPHLKREPDGSVMVPAFTDLKRHDMGDELDSDTIQQGVIPTEQWLTRKLWGFANEPPFLHHGRATLISEAILAHGGEAQEMRDAFADLPEDDQAAVVEFLKTLQILPEGSADLVITAGETAPGSRTTWIAIGGGIGIAFLVALGGLGFAIMRRRGGDVSDS